MAEPLTAAPAGAPDAFLDDARLFTRWNDPQSGIPSFLLTKRVAPFQQSFYFVNPSLTDDGRYYWFYCAFPPTGNANQGRSLAVADLREGRVHHYPETGFTDASPMVDARTGEAYWCSGQNVWKRRPEPDAAPVLVGRFPDGLAMNRRPWRLATHMTLSADRKAVNLDVELGTEWLVGHLPLDGSEFVLWQKFDRCYNHAQFSPADPDLQLIAQDHSVNPITAEVSHYANRMWLIRRGEKARPVFPEPIPVKPHVEAGNSHFNVDVPHTITDARARHGHEWWGRDGRHVWYLRYGAGVERVAVSGGEPERMWPHLTLSHAHADAAETCVVADNIPDDEKVQHSILFRNLATGREAAIVSQLPRVPAALRNYHVHPHPQFCLGDRLISYTTLVRGVVDVAFVRVADLMAATA